MRITKKDTPNFYCRALERTTEQLSGKAGSLTDIKRMRELTRKYHLKWSVYCKSRTANFYKLIFMKTFFQVRNNSEELTFSV